MTACEKSSLEISCCTSCIEHYNESKGSLCSKQDYSDGNIKEHCLLDFLDQKYTIEYCRNVVG
ncbi:MAG: hypothetical protein N3D84_03500 [Candidatus Woesearchaeota archaeon]|nr:hypothetical protein [Candidatus Woesearchaeota archaeon]